MNGSAEKYPLGMAANRCATFIKSIKHKKINTDKYE